MNKKALYESIMRNVAKEVKKVLNESEKNDDNYNFIKYCLKNEYVYIEDLTVKENGDFQGVLMFDFVKKDNQYFFNRKLINIPDEFKQDVDTICKLTSCYLEFEGNVDYKYDTYEGDYLTPGGCDLNIKDIIITSLVLFKDDEEIATINDIELKEIIVDFIESDLCDRLPSYWDWDEYQRDRYSD